MTDLIKRLEQAEAGSRELDAEIAVFIFKEPSLNGDSIYAKLPQRDDNCEPGTFWRKSRSGASLRTAPRYTTSLDAALTLAKKGWWWTINAYSVRMEGPNPNTQRSEGFAATPALALCSASLRAMENDDG